MSTGRDRLILVKMGFRQILLFCLFLSLLSLSACSEQAVIHIAFCSVNTGTPTSRRLSRVTRAAFRDAQAPLTLGYGSYPVETERLPLTADAWDLMQTVERARASGDPKPVIVVLLDDYPFRGRISNNMLAAALGKMIQNLRQAPDVRLLRVENIPLHIAGFTPEYVSKFRETRARYYKSAPFINKALRMNIQRRLPWQVNSSPKHLQSFRRTYWIRFCRFIALFFVYAIIILGLTLLSIRLILFRAFRRNPRSQSIEGNRHGQAC